MQTSQKIRELLTTCSRQQKSLIQGKALSTSAVWKAHTVETDWVAVAEKCSKNMNHEHYGKSTEDILAIWQSKGSTGANRGNIVDDAVLSIVRTGHFDIPEDADDNTRAKVRSVMQFLNTYGSQLGQHVASELWLASNALHANVRCDAMFVNGKTLYIGEWKNNNKITTFSAYKKCTGLLTGYDDCDLMKFNVQLYTYKWIVESYVEENAELRELIDDVKILLVNFTAEGYRALPTMLLNYKTLILELYDATYSRQNRTV